MIKLEDRNGFKILDHGFVALVDSMGSDLSIVRNARVSYDAEWRTGEDTGKDAKLINYLVSNNHTTPLEAVKLTFDVKAPIFVLRQWHRHRTWSYNELSGRYRELPEEFYIPELDQITGQSTTNKQMRTEEQHPEANYFRMLMQDENRNSFEAYREMVAKGCPRELARSVLPVATYSHMFATVDLHNLFKFIGLRSHSHAQYEIRVYSDAMLVLAHSVAPIAVEALCDKLGIDKEIFNESKT
jgi:thymidylate synthase (FAD)